MSLANDFCVEILTNAGATWKHGTRQRGSIPEITLGNSKCLQGFSQDAPSKALNLLDKTLRRIDDMVKQLSVMNPTRIRPKLQARVGKEFEEFLRLSRNALFPSGLRANSCLTCGISLLSKDTN